MPPTRRSKRQQHAPPSSSADDGADGDGEQPLVRATAASAQLLHADGGLVLNILYAIDTQAGLLAMCCVAKAWARQELENRRSLWKVLCARRWPDLGEGAAQTDWRRRYWILSRDGEPSCPSKDEDPLAGIEFVVQARWLPRNEGPPLFSSVVSASTERADMHLHGRVLEFKDCWRLDVSLPAPMPLPPSWRVPVVGRLVQSPPMEVSIMVRRAEDMGVAHFLNFSIRREMITSGFRSSHADCVELRVDTAKHGCAAGCGTETTDAQGKRSRTTAPWLTNLIESLPDGLESVITGFRLEVSPLVLRFKWVEAELQLAGMCFGLGMQLEGNGIVNALGSAMPLCVKEVPATFEHLEWS